MIINLLNDIFLKITLTDFILYIWLPILIILLLITIILIVRYIKKRKEIKNKLLYEKKLKEEANAKILSELQKILTEFDEFKNQRNYKDAIIRSYNMIKNIIIEIYKVKSEDYLTEKEMLNVYAKSIPSSYIPEVITRMYLIYEKVRFGEADVSENEINEFQNYLKELARRLHHATP